jgi:hypothetical protein
MKTPRRCKKRKNLCEGKEQEIMGEKKNDSETNENRTKENNNVGSVQRERLKLERPFFGTVSACACIQNSTIT